MTSTIIYEIVGWVASALVIVSLMQRSIFKLRLIGMGAAVSFLAYGLLISAYPLVIVNVVVLAVHLYFLRKLTGRQAEVFSVLKVYPESRYLAYFLEFYADEISRFQPEFSYEPATNHRALHQRCDDQRGPDPTDDLIDDGAAHWCCSFSVPTHRPEPQRPCPALQCSPTLDAASFPLRSATTALAPRSTNRLTIP